MFMTARIDVEHLPAGSTVDLYISPTCPYCQQAMAYYNSIGQAYTVHDAKNDAAEREKMFAYTGGNPTVPAIVVNGTYVQSGWGKPPRG
jgi:glutaredoxin 3